MECKVFHRFSQSKSVQDLQNLKMILVRNSSPVSRYHEFLGHSAEVRKLFSVNAQILNILGFVGHLVFTATIHLSGCSLKASTDDMSSRGRGCFANETLQK